MFVKNAWYVASLTDDLNNQNMTKITITGEPMILYQAANGEPVAMENRCCHRFAPLSSGRLEGENVRCMYHGLLFDKQGRCIEIPGQNNIPKNAGVKSYPCIARGGWIWVWPGDASIADPTLIPPVRGLDNPDWLMKAGHIDYACNYELINNNLTDLGHLTWVHYQSFKADDAWANIIPEVTAIERGVRINRWLTNIAPIPPLGRAKDVARVDQWAQLDYLAPGIFMFYNAAYPVGTAQHYAYKDPAPTDSNLLFDSYSQQAVTAMTETSTRYFYSWGPSKTFGSWDDAELMVNMAKQAFAEDLEIIQAQAAIVQMDPTRKPLLTIHDKGVALFQRQMQSLMDTV